MTRVDRPRARAVRPRARAVRPRHLLLAAVLAVPTGACGGAAAGGDAGPPEQRELLVVAASSLTDAFEEVAADFETRHPEVQVVLSFGPSSGLVAQVVEGAPAQVAALADPPTMSRLVDLGLVEGQPEVFARNALVVVTPAGDPGGSAVRDVADLADARTVALCGEAVPCGRLAQRVLDEADVDLVESGVTRGRDARATLAAVSHGDADAGVVYATDAAAAAGSVAVVPLPASATVTTDYPIAALGAGGDAAAAADARAFVDHVTSPEGRRTLADHGFLPP